MMQDVEPHWERAPGAVSPKSVDVLTCSHHCKANESKLRIRIKVCVGGSSDKALGCKRKLTLLK